MRTCGICKQSKSLDNFYGDRNKPLGKEYRCKICSSTKRAKDKLKSNYGLTQDNYNNMLKSQHNCCAICKREDTGIERTKKLSVDHCHNTGKVRGLLCNWCNQGLGHFKDSVDLLSQAVSYLSQKERQE